jgi:hypothetical protein
MIFSAENLQVHSFENLQKPVIAAAKRKHDVPLIGKKKVESGRDPAPDATCKSNGFAAISRGPNAHRQTFLHPIFLLELPNVT